MQNELNNQYHKDNGQSQDPVEKHVLALAGISQKELNLVVKKLNYLCNHFDPFDPDNRSNEVENILREYELTSFTSNPYEFTSMVLRLIDKTESTIKLREN